MALRRKTKATQMLVAGQQPKHPVVITAKTSKSLFSRLLNLGMQLFGVGLAGAGASHFAAPKAWEPVSKIAFPEDTRRWTYQNGFTEFLLGLALAYPRTRVLGGIGGVAYAAFLGSRAAGNIRRS